jgi:hypothetical protein
MGDTTEELGIVIDDSPPIVTPEPDEAAPPATPDEPQENKAPEEPDPQKAIAKYAFEARAAKREADALRKQLDEAKKGPQPERPVIPDVPNPLAVSEQQFAQQQAQREEAIRQAAIYDAEQNAIKAQRQAQEAAAQRARLQELGEVGQKYDSRAVQLGIKPNELHEAGAVVVSASIHDGIAELILRDEMGPLITKYLATNPDELDRFSELSRSNPYAAAAELVASLKPKAASLKPKVSNAPAPQDPIGSGAASFSNVGPAGATYE